ncbi:hypothetical protein K503DRAFT_271167 [Rhizopogon vinicolor AM-OR11-026]|uniref:Uncharacterized protein n=1 Tax=Rhizopogon vinicolor AM-OR11-026 TaxID=1314800 RepID=A0A1B7MWD4_9AGAM|nr:hypothetical protein K503DRAFT_271167 [Rhizopogon vinicolor AM-OR11-026]
MVTAIEEELFEHEPRILLDHCFQGEHSSECEVLDKRLRKRLRTRSKTVCGTRYRVPMRMRMRRTKGWSAKANLSVVGVRQSAKCNCRWMWGQLDIAGRCTVKGDWTEIV